MRYIDICYDAIDLYWGAPNSNAATRCFKPGTVTRWLRQLNQLMGATAGYCVLQSAYVYYWILYPRKLLQLW
jgi:hypothetical protein